MKKGAYTILLIIVIMFVGLAGGYVYATTSPLLIEAKELKGTLGALSSYAEESIVMRRERIAHRIGPVFFLSHLAQLQEQVADYKKVLESKPFDQDVPLSKAEVLALVGVLEDEFSALREQPESTDEGRLEDISARFKDLASLL